MGGMDHEWLSVKAFAEKAGVSLQSIYKQIDGRLKPYVKESKGKKVISSEAITVFYSDIKPDSNELNQIQPNIQPDSTTTNQNNTTNFNRIQPDIQPDSTTMYSMETALKALQEQLKVKDKQIEQLTNSVQNLTEALKTAHALAAEDKKRVLELTRKQDESPEEVVYDLENVPEEKQPEESPEAPEQSEENEPGDNLNGSTTEQPPETEKKSFLQRIKDFFK